MKSILISVLMLSMTLFFVSCENEGQPTENASDVETQILDKKPHDGDLITFTGDLVGSEIVMGCCPNAGPSPIYQSLELIGPPPTVGPFPEGIYGTYTGNIFMNSTGRQSPGAYIVQFWWSENVTDTTFIEIRGGVADKDKRTKVLTVTFTQDKCWIYYPNGVVDSVLVDFILIRDPQRFSH